MKLAPLIFAALAVIGCKDRVIHVQQANPADTASKATGSDQPDLELRSYTVPKGQGQQVKSMINSLLYNVKDRIGASAQLTPNNELVVIAPEGIHSGIAAMIERMGKGGAPDVPPTIEMNFWIVFGEAAGEVTVPRDLKEIDGALTAIAEAQGPMKFTLRDRGSVVSESHERAETHGRYAFFRYTALYTNDVLRAQLEIQPRLKDSPAELKTMVRLAPGKTLVLGQIGGGDRLQGGPERQMFYIVRANVNTGK